MQGFERIAGLTGKIIEIVDTNHTQSMIEWKKTIPHNHSFNNVEIGKNNYFYWRYDEQIDFTKEILLWIPICGNQEFFDSKHEKKDLQYPLTEFVSLLHKNEYVVVGSNENGLHIAPYNNSTKNIFMQSITNLSNVALDTFIDHCAKFYIPFKEDNDHKKNESAGCRRDGSNES